MAPGTIPCDRPGYHPGMPPPIPAATLLRDVGLFVDGPMPWGRPVPARTAGVFVIEAPAPRATVPLELTTIGKWIERVPELRLDGERPSSRSLARRLGSFWLPGQVVLYVGSTSQAIGAKVAAIGRTPLGDRRPSPAGHWLHLLTTLSQTRVWWAATEAVEEYEDAVLAAFADAVPAEDRAALPDPSLVLPWANLRRPTGERRATGITDPLLPEAREPAPKPTFVTRLPDGDAEGTDGSPEPRRPRRPVVAQPAPAPIRRAMTPRQQALAAAATDGTGGAGGASLTAEGSARLQAELDELITVRRPDVIARIRAAKELGDLKENADYTSAREEQSFLEGRIQALEARLRNAVVVEAPREGERADLGSKVTVEVDGVADTYTLVSTAEADARAGRLSIASPVGRALVGATPGSEVQVQTPRGAATYRVLSVE
jgi:transcription elongation factor GreA